MNIYFTTSFFAVSVKTMGDNSGAVLCWTIGDG